MPVIDPELAKVLGAGGTVALFMFFIWWRTEMRREREAKAATAALAKRDDEHIGQLNAHIERLNGVLQTRRADNEKFLALYGRFEAHLVRDDRFEAFARAVLKEQTVEEPKRRTTDELVAELEARG